MANSLTFRPEIVYSAEMECYFIDVAGYMDAYDKFFDLLYSFVIKYLFENAKSVKFLCPITFDEISLSGGKAIRDLLE